MASRAQIDRISRSVDRIASAMRPAAVSYVPLYQDETEAGALAAYGEEFGIPEPWPHLVEPSMPATDEQHAWRAEVHGLHCLGPSDIRQLLVSVDGKTRGIPTVRM